MDRTLFAFIWKHSKRQQLLLLLLTTLSFPLLYVSLELPKRIINDAIGATNESVTVYGFTFTQIEYLVILCVLFLLSVLAAGLMKMRINTMKGVLAERLLRRFRYQLLGRMLRFPKPYFRTTSQGELVAMITSEAEPMGGLMGDAVAQPVFQAGQMITIMAFLFAQSIWFGLASMALIPLQAWLIPMLQRQINLLNKDRIVQVRRLASEIGESAAGISDVRTNGGWRYRMAVFTDRLGQLFEIRFRIYQKKFFMKFLNNFITQLTPFFFYLVGGYLAITGEISVGALVAALGAYKDLSGPWRELLAYYNQTQDMALRWQIVTERFAPSDMVSETLFEGDPGEIPRLNGAIEMDRVSVRDQDGNTVLQDISLTIPSGAHVAIQSRSAVERRAFADLLTREVLPSRGTVTLSGHRVETLHQTVLATRVGYAHSRPYLFDGTLGDNLMMPLMSRPVADAEDSAALARKLLEADRSGNSADVLDAPWIDPTLAGLQDQTAIQDWWFQLIVAMGQDTALYRRTLRSRFDPVRHSALAEAIVTARTAVAQSLDAAGLSDCVYRFEPDQFNPTVPLGGNLLYAAPTRYISQEGLAADDRFMAMLHKEGLDDDALAISQGVIRTLRQTFGRDGTDHPLFHRLGLDDATFKELVDIDEKRQSLGDAGLSAGERALMTTVPFTLTAEQIGHDFPQEYKDRILRIRLDRASHLRRQVGDLFTEISPDAYIPRLNVMENALFGRVPLVAGAKAVQVEQLVADVLDAQGLRQTIAALVFDQNVGLGGANLPTIIQERAAFSRAGLKRPDILILDKAMASFDSHDRSQTRHRMRALLPDTTLLFMEDSFAHPEAYDMVIEIDHGRIDGIAHADTGGGSDDLRRKLQIIGETALFSRIDTRNQRLLAFSAQWFEAEPGQVIFAAGEDADAAYLCLEGEAELHFLAEGQPPRVVSQVRPGRLIGDLSIIIGEPRRLQLVSCTSTRFLRIGAEELRAVIDNDASVAASLLETVSDHFSVLLNRMQTEGRGLSEQRAPHG